MKLLILTLFILILTLIWPLDLSETITACVFLAVLGAIASLSPLGNWNLM